MSMTSEDLIERIKEAQDDLEKSTSGGEIYAIRNGLAGLLLNNLSIIVAALQTVADKNVTIEECADAVYGCGECDHDFNIRRTIRALKI